MEESWLCYVIIIPTEMQKNKEGGDETYGFIITHIGPLR